jgi:hypothetical protein
MRTLNESHNLHLEERARNSVLSDKQSISDSWKLLCAAAELLAALAGVDRKYEALLKFTKTVGEVGVKLIEPITSTETSTNATTPILETVEDRFNIEPLLRSLGISSISLTSANLQALLSERYIETSRYAIHLLKGDHWSTLPRRWHQGRVQLMEDATLSIRAQLGNGGVPTLMLSFGHVRLSGRDRELRYVELAVTESTSASVEFILSRQRLESEQVYIRLDYIPNSREVLKEFGIRIISRSLDLACFKTEISVVGEANSAFQCVLLIKANHA